MLTRHPERRESVLDRHGVLVEEEFSHTDAFGISPAMFEWIDHYLGEGIDEAPRWEPGVGPRLSRGTPGR
jgi:hypothetical protein